MLFSSKIFKLEIILDIITSIVGLVSNYMTPSMIGLCHMKAKTQRQTRAEDECIVEDADTDVDDQSGDNCTNNGNDRKSCFAKNTKCTMTGNDNEDKRERQRNYGYDGCRHNIPIVTNYYCYDQRVYNIYRVRDEEESVRSHGLSICDEALKLLKLVNWRYVLIATFMMIVGIALVFCLGVDMLSWLIFHKVFGYLFNHNLLVAKDREAVPLQTD